MLGHLLALFVILPHLDARPSLSDDPDLFHFVTVKPDQVILKTRSHADKIQRPDLKPPRWNITVYDESSLSSGYWFVNPKKAWERTIGSGLAWTGPAIYDGKGELIWSGITQFDSSNINDFRLNEVYGEPMMTMVDRDRKLGVLLDSHYTIRQLIDVVRKNDSEWIRGINAHEFKFVDGGKRVLFIRNNRMQATEREKEAVGFDGDVCWASYNELLEIDVETGDLIFNFNSHGHVGIDESTFKNDERLPRQCQFTWDFMHTNSLDKCDDGDFLLNSRHTDTIYKISKDNSSIVWRLGGKKSDFDMGDVMFSRQHDIRCRAQNETHMIISILDNAKGEDDAPPTHEFSRGLFIALNTVNMTASLVAAYDHPYGILAPRRGNLQILKNGNIFMGWSEQGRQSEYSANGTLLFKARLRPDWTGSYRNYKFDYVGRPLTRPDVAAAVYLGDEITTKVFVSWNGDTEVKVWKLYEISSDSDEERLVAEVEKNGFETYLEWSGYASYVRVEGVDADGEVLSSSDVLKTDEHPGDPDSAAAADDFLEWEGDVEFEDVFEFHDDL